MDRCMAVAQGEDVGLGGPGILLELDAGPRPTVLEMPGAGDEALLLISPICFEATVPSVTRSLSSPARSPPPRV